MPSPFPGMDPYLEAPDIWPDVHNRLIAAIGDTLGPSLRPGYVVRLEERVYLAEPEGLAFIGRPDLSVRGGPDAPQGLGPEAAGGALALAVEVPVPDHVRETYLEVRSVGDGNEVVTVLELLSPTNKVPGEGRRLYEEKRTRVLGTRTNLVEVDLIRTGEPMLVFGANRAADYRILVSRGDRRPRADLYLFSVRSKIPVFRLPLRKGDEEPELDMVAILADLYDHAAYDLSIDYGRPPIPQLAEQDRGWAEQLVASAHA